MILVVFLGGNLILIYMIYAKRSKNLNLAYALILPDNHTHAIEIAFHISGNEPDNTINIIKTLTLRNEFFSFVADLIYSVDQFLLHFERVYSCYLVSLQDFDISVNYIIESFHERLDGTGIKVSTFQKYLNQLDQTFVTILLFAVFSTLR